MKIDSKLCELCKEEASVYCWADAAFLCRNCDDKVHRANFLVARHLRNALCSQCKSCFAHRNSHLCNPCSDVFDADRHSSSSSSDCFSSSNGFEPKSRPVLKPLDHSSSSSSSSTASFSDVVSNASSGGGGFRGVFAVWCENLGVSKESVVPTATTALRLCLERLAALPFRVSLAAAFWVGLRMAGGGGDRSGSTWRNLRRVEELSGVPAKVIVAVEPRLARAMRLRRRSRRIVNQDLEEGWAESV